MRNRHRFLSLLIIMASMFLIGYHSNIAYAQIQEGLYFNGTSSVFYTIDDFIADTDRGLQYVYQTDDEDIVIILDGKMTTLQDLAEKDFNQAFFPMDYTKLRPMYTRIADGSTITIDQSQADNEPPEIEYIR